MASRTIRIPPEFHKSMRKFKMRVEQETSIKPSDAEIFRGLAPKLENIMIKKNNKIGRRKAKRKGFMEFL